MTTIEDRKAAQQHKVIVVLRLIADGEVSSIGDDHWYLYDDTTPQGHRITNIVESLIDRGYARAHGYYDVHITRQGREFRAEIERQLTAAEPTTGGE